MYTLQTSHFCEGKKSMNNIGEESTKRVWEIGLYTGGNKTMETYVKMGDINMSEKTSEGNIRVSEKQAA